MNAAVRTPIRAGSALYWLCQIGGWGLYGLSNLIAYVTIEHAPLGTASVELSLLAALGIGMTHGLRWHMRVHGWARLSLRARVVRILIACALLGVAAGGVSSMFGSADWHGSSVSIGGFTPQPATIFVIRCLNWASLLLCWCVLYYAVQSIRDRKSAQLRESEIARALQASELRLLKSQLNPHFLFNALNTVRALVSFDPPGAQQAITQLARTLRYTLNASQEEFVTLDEELAIVADYLALEALRLGERLTVERHIDPAAHAVRIPVMLLQTLVENAIKHGIAELPAGGTLKIEAVIGAAVLTLTVENPRPKEVTGVSGEGIGLRNARERLRLLYGNAASLSLDTSRSPLIVAQVTVPLDHEDAAH